MAAKPGVTVPPAPPRTSGQVTPNDEPPPPPQETDKTLDLRPTRWRPARN